MSNRDAFTSLVGQLGKTRAEGVKLSRLSVSKLNTDSAAAHSPSSARPATSHDVKSQSFSSAGATHDDLRFGSPSNNRSAGAPGSSQWVNLLKHAASGGLASVLTGGGGLLSSVSGVGGLISSIVGLFGGSHKKAVPLSLFSLHSSENQSLSVSGNSQRSMQTNALQGGAYGPQATTTPTTQLDHQPYQFQSAQIAQAVKQALLNSSDLNDVIAEI